MTDCGEDVGESLEDARRMIKEFREKTRIQAQQLLAWRRAYKMQEVLISRLHREKADQLKTLSAKLLLFESRLIRKQKDISMMLNNREIIIQRQQRIIDTLTNRLIDNGLEPPISDLSELDTNLLDLESLNDSDSAVVMEDLDSDCNLTMTHIPKYGGYGGGAGGGGCITVVRSISDAIDPNLKYTIRRTNGFLRRPEILETVYSVEEDADSSEANSESKSEANKKRDAFAACGSTKAIVASDEPSSLLLQQKDKGGGEEKIISYHHQQHQHHHGLQQPSPPTWMYENNGKISSSNTTTTNNNEKSSNQVTTYNRVMSNHRSVTKPKDVKYKRINKAKSKSLEELRGRLKNWVEQGSKIAGLSLEHSQSYA